MICMERHDGLYSEYREATQTRGVQPKAVLRESLWQHSSLFDDDDVYYYICWRLKLEGETENTGVVIRDPASGLFTGDCINNVPVQKVMVHFSRDCFGRLVPGQGCATATPAPAGSRPPTRKSACMRVP